MEAIGVIVNESVAADILKSLQYPDSELAFRARHYLRARLLEESLGYPIFSDRAKQILSDEIAKLSR